MLVSKPLVPFLHDLTHADLPGEVRAFARRWLLDLIGVAAGGSRTDLSRIIRNHAARQFAAGDRSARMLFDGRPVSPAGAALAGGMTIDALDGHDGHKLTKGHAGCGTFPALLALFEAEGRTDGAEFLTALVLGYEIGTRAGIALHRTACDYHTTGAWIAPTCAALGARILRLDTAKTRHAIGIAEYHGPRSQMMRCIDAPTMVKDGSGWGAMAGVSAAYLAADGFTGAPALTVEGRRRRRPLVRPRHHLAHLRAVLQTLPGLPLGPAPAPRRPRPARPAQPHLRPGRAHRDHHLPPVPPPRHPPPRHHRGGAVLHLLPRRRRHGPWPRRSRRRRRRPP